MLSKPAVRCCVWGDSPFICLILSWVYSAADAGQPRSISSAQCSGVHHSLLPRIAARPESPRVVHIFLSANFPATRPRAATHFGVSGADRTPRQAHGTAETQRRPRRSEPQSRDRHRDLKDSDLQHQIRRSNCFTVCTARRRRSGLHQSIRGRIVVSGRCFVNSVCFCEAPVGLAVVRRASCSADASLRFEFTLPTPTILNVYAGAYRFMGSSRYIPPPPPVQGSGFEVQSSKFRNILRDGGVLSSSL